MKDYTTNIQKWQVTFLELTDEHLKENKITGNCEPQSFACSWEQLKLNFGSILTPDISRIPNAQNLTVDDLKNYIPAFMNARFKPNSRKLLTRVKEITIIGLDIDNKNPSKRISYEDLKKLVENWGWRAIIYTTYSHTEDYPRFRVVLFPNKPISKKDWPRVWDSLNCLFDKQLDNATKRLNTYFYLPSKPIGSDEGHFVEVFDGNLLDIKTLPPAPMAESNQEALESPSEGIYGHYTNWLSDEELQNATERFREQYQIRRLEPIGGRDDSNSALEFSLLLYCVGRRASFNCVQKWFNTDGKFENYNKNKSRLKYNYRRARKRPHTAEFLDSLGEVRRIVPRVREHIEQDCETFKGRKAESIKQVLQAHLTEMEKTGKTTYDFAARDIAKILNLSYSTCNNHTKALIEQGWLGEVNVKLVRGHGRKCTLGPKLNELWEIYKSETNSNSEGAPHICGYVCVNSRQFDGIQSTDVCGQTETFGVFTHQTLGPLCEKIFLLLKNDSLRIGEIEQTTNRSLRTIKDKLKRMERLSIVTVVKGTVALNPDLNLREMGETLGTIDKKVLKDARLTREQEDFKIRVEIERHTNKNKNKEAAHKWHLERQYQPTEAEIQFYAELDIEREQYEADYADYQAGLI